MLALIARDIRIALRTGSGFGLSLAFYLIFVLLLALGVGGDRAMLAQSAPAILWVGCLLAAMLSLDRIFQADMEDGSLDGLALAPMPLASVVIAKIAAHWLTTGLPLSILAPCLAVLLNMETAGFVWLFAGLIVGTMALSAIGTIGAAITLTVRRGGLLLSLLVMPLYVPTLIFGVVTVQAALEGGDPLNAFALLGAVTLFSLVIAPIFSAWSLRVSMQ
jgi:heme exporter protein B